MVVGVWHTDENASTGKKLVTVKYIPCSYKEISSISSIP